MSDPTDDVLSETATPHSPRKKSVMVFLPLLVLGLPILVLWGNSDRDDPEIISPPLVSNLPEENTDDIFRKMIIGNWETNRNGRRFMTVHADGTATMDVAVEGTWSLLFGSKLHFEIEWSIEEGKLTMTTVGGDPKGKIDLLTSMYGKERVQQITLLDETTMRLPDDEPDGEEHVWTRVESD